MKRFLATGLSLVLLGATVPAPTRADGELKIKHVLLVSIDGMHAVDYLNCSKGLSEINGGAPYCPNLKELGETGVNYLDTSTSKPSDSFPGLTGIVTGGSPRTTGVYYDVAYDRVYAPPKKTTGNGLAGDPMACTPNKPHGTSSEYEEGIDKHQEFLNGIDGISTPNGDGGIYSIDPDRLIRDPFNNCAPVYPWNFVRVNSVFSVAHKAGLYVAWSDKHPAYASVAGPGDGTTLDDFYSPEINSNVVALPKVTTVLGLPCSPIPDPNSDLTAWTNSFKNIQCYDTLKVNGVLNQIEGFNHNRSKKAKVPALFGMNFQAVSVGQKLIEPNVGSGGYSDAMGTPSHLLREEIEFVDAAIGQWISALKKENLYDCTLIIITAKHGQSPIDSSRYLGISNSPHDPISTAPSQLIDKCLPDSESNAGGQIGPTEDDVSLLWLRKSCSAKNEVEILESQSPASNNVAGIGIIFWGRSILTYFGKPGIPPNGDSRTPDIIITPNVGVTYSGSTGKQAEHGGFSHDDTNVMILVSNPSLDAKTVTSTVETLQIAPTILKALGLAPSALDAVRAEGTQGLPGLPF